MEAIYTGVATPVPQSPTNAPIANDDSGHDVHNMESVSQWANGKNFGAYRGHRVLDNKMIILSHTGGFAVFFPPEVFHRFDVQVPITRSTNPENACWIAGKGYGFLKMDVTLDPGISEETKKYIADDIDVALNKIEEFVNKNFVSARGLTPDSEWNTHGSYVRNPDMPRPFRFRLGGDYHLKF
jgi:hypothetical protein